MINKNIPFEKIGEYQYKIPKTYRKKMTVDVIIIASEKLIKAMENEVFEQLVNVASLPSLVNYVICMPDGHVGYGCPIGGVFASKKEGGIISPGAVGFDINCGMRLLRTTLLEKDALPYLEKIVELLFTNIPSGVGSSGFLKLNKVEFKEVIKNGALWAVNQGFGQKVDLLKTEESGRMTEADPGAVSEKAIERGLFQLGTLGSGNHYLEVQVVEKIFDPTIAKSLGIEGEGQVVVMFHCGSRGFGHQVATDYLSSFGKKMFKYNIKVEDRQLACAPFESIDGQAYFKAMSCACNFAFANRQIITCKIREVLTKVFGEIQSPILEVVYDVSHNIAKIEDYKIDGQSELLIVHRKGATRSFPNQPVILGGSMQSGSYLLLGSQKATDETFGSTAHGSGRTMSRQKAKRMVEGRNLLREMKNEGIFVKTTSYSGLAEEAGLAYKNIHEVVEVLDGFGISKKIAYFRPIGNVKG